MTTSAARTGVTTYDTPSDREFRFIRVVDAPIAVAFDVWTKPEHVQKWLIGPEGWTMPICEVDLRVGGTWRFGWKKGSGEEMTMNGTYTEVDPPRRVVSTEQWGSELVSGHGPTGEWPVTINTVEFTESGGKTTITLTITYPTKKDRDQAMATGMKDGMETSYARLDALVAKLRR